MARTEEKVLICSLHCTVHNIEKKYPMSSQRQISNQNKANKGKQNKRTARQAQGLPRESWACGMGVGVSAWECMWEFMCLTVYTQKSHVNEWDWCRGETQRLLLGLRKWASDSEEEPLFLLVGRGECNFCQTTSCLSLKGGLGGQCHNTESVNGCYFNNLNLLPQGASRS